MSKYNIKEEQDLVQTIQNVADAIEYVGENSIGNMQGDHTYSIADSLESIALTFNRWVDLQEKIYEKNK